MVDKKVKAKKTKKAVKSGKVAKSTTGTKKAFVRPSIVSRVEKKNGGLGKVPKLDKELLHTIEVLSTQPVKIAGQVISADENRIVFRHKKKSGSTKIVVSTFPVENVLSLVGKVGEFGEIVILQEVQLYLHKDAKVKYTNAGLVALTKSGDNIVLRTTPSVTFRVFADE